MPINSLLYPVPSPPPAYSIDNSCRFDDGSSAYMHKTPGSAGSLRKVTISCWFKKTQAINGTTWQQILNCSDSDGNPYFAFGLKADKFTVSSGSGSVELRKQSTQVLRDPSAWYHLCVSIDTTDGTAGDRVKMYINGTRVTSFAASTDPSLNYDFPSLNTTSYAINIGRDDYGGGEGYLDGNLAELFFIDGTAYAASSFGEYNEDSPTIWQPKNCKDDLTFGTNGFYLDFKDSSNLGNDANGGTDLTEVNLAATDSSTDSPTNNWCTMNPLSCVDVTDMSENNLKVRLETSDDSIMSTFAMSKGKWYWEEKRVTQGARGYTGVCDYATPEMGGNAARDASTEWAIMIDHNGNTEGSGVTVNSHVKGSAPSDNDIFTYAFDADNGQVWVGVNANVDISGTANVTGLATGVPYFYFFEESGGSDPDETVLEMNFGNPINSISSGNSDDNGYGNFEYAVPSGYYALCTKNLAEKG